MHQMTIDRGERDTLRRLLIGEVEGPLDELRRAALGDRDGLDDAERADLTVALGLLDAVGWELEGSSDSYLLGASPELAALLDRHRVQGQEQAEGSLTEGETERAREVVAVCDAIRARCLHAQSQAA